MIVEGAPRQRHHITCLATLICAVTSNSRPAADAVSSAPLTTTPAKKEESVDEPPAMDAPGDGFDDASEDEEDLAKEC